MIDENSSMIASEMIKMNKNVKYVIVLAIMVVAFVLIGGSFSYYEAIVHGNGNTIMEGGASTASISDLRLSGTTEVVNTNMIPGERSEYSFSVENTNDKSVCFGIYLDNLTNTFVNTNDLEISIDEKKGVFPNVGDTSTIIDGINIPANSTYLYTLVVTYKDVEDKNQAEDMGGSFEGIIKARIGACN